MDLQSINSLSVATGIDRRTLGKRLRDIEPTETRGRVKYYDYADKYVADAVHDRRGSGVNHLRDFANSPVALFAGEVAEAAGRVLHAKLPPDLACELTAATALASIAAWRNLIVEDVLLRDVCDFADPDTAARTLLRNPPKGVTRPNRDPLFFVSAWLKSQILQHGPLPAHVLGDDDE